MSESHQTFDLWIAFFLIIMYIVYDALYAIYYMFLEKKKPLSAANTASAMYLIGAIGTITFVHNPWYIASIAIGSFLGTFLAVKYLPNKIK